jgi:type I restriction enzyme, S subunit
MKFKDFCTFKEGYVNPSQKIASYFDGPIKWLRATDLNNSYVYNTSRTLTEEGFKSAGKSSILFKPDTIAISKSGTIGRIGILKDYMCGNRAIINIEVNQEKMNLRYVFYWLLNEQNYIQNLAVGSVQKNLYISVLEQLEIADRPLREQKAIADILSALDDKIELNNQINKNLEEMAQAIFKSWFIDFEPFQDGEFVESELGLIPKGWEVKQIGNVCTVVGGGTPKTKVAEYWEGGDILWATPSDMTSKNCPVIYNTSRKITQEGLNNSAAKLLPSGSVIMTSRATIGYSAITMKELCTNQGFINVVCNKDISSYYMLFYLKHSKDKIIGLANGSTFLEISRKVFKEIDIVVPPKHILEKFNEIVEPIIQSIYQFEVEIQKLTNLRDTLLPKLMSGEIRVPLENEGRHQDEQLQRV